MAFSVPTTWFQKHTALCLPGVGLRHWGSQDGAGCLQPWPPGLLRQSPLQGLIQDQAAAQGSRAWASDPACLLPCSPF